VFRGRRGISVVSVLEGKINGIQTGSRPRSIEPMTCTVAKQPCPKTLYRSVV